MLLTEYNETKTMELFKEEGRAQGRAEGRAQGEQKLSSLIAALMTAGRPDDALKAALDPDLRKQLYTEMNIQ